VAGQGDSKKPPSVTPGVVCAVKEGGRGRQVRIWGSRKKTKVFTNNRRTLSSTVTALEKKKGEKKKKAARTSAKKKPKLTGGPQKQERVTVKPPRTEEYLGKLPYSGKGLFWGVRKLRKAKGTTGRGNRRPRTLNPKGRGSWEKKKKKKDNKTPAPPSLGQKPSTDPNKHNYIRGGKKSGKRPG